MTTSNANKKAIDVIKRAKALIPDPDHWIKGSLSRKEGGVRCYCAVGALRQASMGGIYRSSNPAYMRAHSTINSIMPNRSIPDFNDDPATTHKDVIDLFDRAIGELSKP